MENELYHLGTPHEGATPHSGRWPWGSGANPNQHPKDFLTLVNNRKQKGMTDDEIREAFGLTVDQYRAHLSTSKRVNREIERAEDQKLIDNGVTSRSERARILSEKLGYEISESTLRSRESDSAVSKDQRRKATADLLRKEVDEYGIVDIGKGVPTSLGITQNRLNEAIAELEYEGYIVHRFNQRNMSNPAVSFPMVVLCRPGTEYPDVFTNKDQIHVINAKFESKDGVGLLGLRKPEAVDPKRVEIVYGDKGAEKDGIIELRPGVADLDLGNANYAQVRINVDDTHYIKGVAVYADDLPPGKDIRFNTNKALGTPMLGPKEDTVLKPLKRDKLSGEIDWDNPFGSAIQEGGQKGALNIVHEEGDWQEWSRTLSSQFLSKQSEKLAERQLRLSIKEKQEEYETIMGLTNPTLRKQQLMEFGDQCDTASVYLKAAAMPNQSTGLLLPVSSMKPTEVYARNYENGTQVCLIRHPHGGIFEIPQLTVNNNNKEAQKLIGDSTDAVGIHHSVAQQLSGADFDGDTVVVIPNNKGDIKVSKILEGLEGFDPKCYKLPSDKPGITEDYKQKQMGIVSNLITDMTLRGAPPEHLVRAVKHSMVVIDAEKHHLDWKQSEKDQRIDELKRLYQPSFDEEGNLKYGGASTLISRAKSTVYVDERKPSAVAIDPATGKKSYPDWTLTGAGYYDKKGNWIKKQSEVHKMSTVEDARELLSTANGGRGTAMERVYADYANTMKSMGNTARKQALAIKDTPQDKEAAKAYAPEVASLKQKLAEALAWAPKERHAHLYADAVVKAKREQYGDTLDKKMVKRIRNQALKEGRAQLGGRRSKIEFTDREWEAIQKHALPPSVVKEIFTKTDQDYLKQKAMPTRKVGLTPAQLATAKALIASGHSFESVAKRYGVSLSTIQRAVKG